MGFLLCVLSNHNTGDIDIQWKSWVTHGLNKYGVSSTTANIERQWRKRGRVTTFVNTSSLVHKQIHIWWGSWFHVNKSLTHTIKVVLLPPSWLDELYARACSHLGAYKKGYWFFPAAPPLPSTINRFLRQTSVLIYTRTLPLCINIKETCQIMRVYT